MPMHFFFVSFDVQVPQQEDIVLRLWRRLPEARVVSGPEPVGTHVKTAIAVADVPPDRQAVP